MPQEENAPVLIVGAGPVGLVLALDLAWRGIKVTVAEMRRRAEPPEPKCNHVAARTMEIFRRLGVVEKIRNSGLPADYPHDISYRTTFTGQELTRIRIPCRRDRYTDARAAASDQSDFPRADPVRTRRGPAQHRNPEPDGGRAGRAFGRSGDGHAS
jgi:2-polyprenyl-6-methoxyphenol hydroxylase-like FAD-dependent oxidoreductase